MSLGGVSVSAPAGEQPPKRLWVIYALTGLTVVAGIAVAGMTGVRLRAFSATEPTLRLVASTCFVLAGFLGSASSGWSLYSLLMLGGLVFCWVGDVVGPLNFMCGVGSFLLGHCCFAGAFCMRGLVKRRVIGGGVVYLIAGGLISAWLLPHVPRGALPMVVSYIIVISAMAVMAWSAEGTQRGWLIGAAALLFYVSDIFVARGQYVAGGKLNGIMCYPLYYAACLMLALSIVLAPPPKRT